MMKCILNVALVVLAGTVLPVYSRSQTAQEICGTGGTILDSKTVVHNGNEIKIVATSCPSLSGRGNASAVVSGSLQKRQTLQCAELPGICTIECATIPNAAPNLQDCEIIAEALESTGEAFLVQSNSQQDIMFQTCSFAFFNFDTVEYEVCETSFGFNSLTIAEECFGSGAGTGVNCLSPQVPGNDWLISVNNPTF